MARYKTIDTSPRFIAVDLQRQLLPSSFEHALNYLVDRELDLVRFDACYKNDLTGASAWPPAMLLKVVLFAYSRPPARASSRATAASPPWTTNTRSSSRRKPMAPAASRPC